MNDIIIPYELDKNLLNMENEKFYLEKYNEKRTSLLNELRYVTAIPEIVSSFNQDTVYKLVAIPEGGELLKDSAGNLKGVFYKDGKILEHAKFKAINPSLIKAASAIGSQILLISIAMQLNRIEKGISKIREELHNDRLSEIFSGVEMFNHAIKMNNKTNQSNSIINAIQSLTTGLEKTTRSLKLQIEDIPNPNISFFDNWIKNKSDTAKEKFLLAEESFKASLIGIKTLSECYIVLDEPNLAASVLKEYVIKLKNSGIREASEKARLLPSMDNSFPEESWLCFLNNESLLVNNIEKCNTLSNEQFQKIEIEFKPKEIMEN